MGYQVRGDKVYYGTRVYVYLFSYTTAEKIPSADGKTFDVLDRRTCYDGEPIPDAGPATFTVWV